MTTSATIVPRSPSSSSRSASAPTPADAVVAPEPNADAAASTALDASEFPGCRAVRISRQEIDDYGRIEYWDAATEIAMVCEGVSVYHEHPSQRVAQMTTLIALTRGSPIETFGHADLLLRDEHGERRRIMQADQTVYLNPQRDRPAGASMVVGEDTLPDVIVEVDHTTDVRRRKLSLYESWGLPEVWVEVPDAPSPSRAASRAPGLTIHLLHPDGAYRESAESRAFPGWRASEIHRSMNEATLSIETMAVLDRVARALRDQDGAETGDAPFLRRMRAEGLAAGRAEGLAAGRAEGLAAGRAEGLAEQRTLLCRRAARRFGPETAERLAVLIAGVDDPDHFADIGEWIVTCPSASALLDRCSRPRPS